MDIRTVQNCIALLSELRDVYQSRLDTGVIAEIDEVIAALEVERRELSEGRDSIDWSFRVLKVIGEVIRVATDFSNLIG